MTTAPSPPQPGLLVLHGNRLEALAEAVFAWLARAPLPGLHQETFLVQSNGMAEWLKMELASAHGICAATRVELPARFIWRAYRAVLGRSAVPALSPLDKLPLTWRLMRLLPQLATAPGFEPVAGFLDGGGRRGDAARRLQLAQRLADLLDQYQVYRSDWLQDWADGRDQLRAGNRQPLPVPADQLWQPALWRAALQGLDGDAREATRPQLHQRFLQALQTAPAPGAWPQLPRRVVLFGTTHIPHQTLEAIAALSVHTQVLMAVPNPSRYHWADTLAGRELLREQLRARQRRHPLRNDHDLATVPLQAMHAHGHPLLSAWGRQSRDFVRQLDAFDDVVTARARFDVPRVDLFDDGPGETLLQQVQARIRDLVPLHEHDPTAVLASTDRSIVFHVAHSAQREVDILHDQLLHLLAQPPGGATGQRALNPRDIVVMVPDIDTFAPAIRAVFGQHGRGHPRHIPWGIADQRGRGHHPLLVALEWLLRAPQQRFAFSQLRDLLDVPALAHRFHIAADDLPTLVRWIEGAGVRWGLHAGQRAALDLAACGDANSWHFGLRRMLLGYATGDLDDLGGFASGHDGIEPYGEVAGLQAGLAGALAELLDVLQAWWADCVTARPPEAWGQRLRQLVQDLFSATDDAERATVAVLAEALAEWLQACDAAGFDDAIELAVVREAWLDGVDAPGLSQRFKAGGVTFCTLLPLRAIPFEVVCLLGMNDGDYPRRSPRSDFDLLALPGLARPGDRSRRDDDRQLMLDALLSARRVLHVSWVGRSQRDNEKQPPSVLVAQLLDHLRAGWGDAAVDTRTTHHPLQPFSRAYFERRGAGNVGLLTYAAEWRSAHADVAPVAAVAAAPLPPAEPLAELDIDTLARFLRNPVKAFFAHRLQVRFDERDAAADDDESFASTGLQRWQLMDDAVRALQRQLDGVAPDAGADAPSVLVDVLVDGQLARLQRAGRLPLAGPGERTRADLRAVLRPMLAQWHALLQQHPRQHDKQGLRLQQPAIPGLVFSDWLSGLRAAAAPGATPLRLELRSGRLASNTASKAPGKTGTPRADKLLPAWVQSLAAAACGVVAGGVLIGEDVVVQLPLLDADDATQTLHTLMQACSEGLLGSVPMPTAVRTGLAWLQNPDKARRVYEAGAGSEGSEPCLARLFPDFDSLQAAPGFDAASQLLYAPYQRWLDSLTLQPLPGCADPVDSDSMDGDGGMGGESDADSADEDGTDD